MFQNKLDEYGQVVRNKAILVCKGYTQVEGINFEETYNYVAKMEAIKIHLAMSKSIK